MEVQSAFNAGVQGFQKAQEDAYQAASAIANQTFNSEDFSQGQALNQETIGQNTGSGDLSDLNQEIVNLKVAEFQAKASAEVIQTADDTLGTLLDVTA